MSVLGMDVLGHPLVATQPQPQAAESPAEAATAPLPLSLADCVMECDTDGEDNKETQSTVHRSYLDVEYDCEWQPARVERVNNKQLEQEYEEKKKELMLGGRKDEELEDSYGFIVQNNVNELQSVVVNGIQTSDSSYNPLGYNRLGIYLCRHADVCLQQAITQTAQGGGGGSTSTSGGAGNTSAAPSTPSASTTTTTITTTTTTTAAAAAAAATNIIRMVVCKYMAGRSTTAIPRTAGATEFIEPTQGYDSHICALEPLTTQPVQAQFDKSQVYLYEIDKLLRPSTRPRHVIPHAIVTYTVHGAYHTDMDSKPTVAAPPPVTSPTHQAAADSDGTSSPRQIQIIGGMGANKMEPLATTNPGLLKVVTDGASMSPTVPSSILGNPNSFPGGVINANGGASGLEPTNTDDVEKSPQVQAIVNQINARLEAQEKTKIAMNVGALTGSSLMTGSTSPGARSAQLQNCVMANGSGGMLLGALPHQSVVSQSAVYAAAGLVKDTQTNSILPKLATMQHQGLGAAAALGSATGITSHSHYPDPAALALRGLGPLSFIPGTSIPMHAATQRALVTQAAMQQNGLSAMPGLAKPNGFDYSQINGMAAAAAAGSAAAGGFLGHFHPSAAPHGMESFGALQSQVAHNSLAAAGALYPGFSGLPAGLGGGLASLPQSAFGLNRAAGTQSSLKRPYSDTGAAAAGMADLEKRQKFF